MWIIKREADCDLNRATAPLHSISNQGNAQGTRASDPAQIGFERKENRNFHVCCGIKAAISKPVPKAACGCDQPQWGSREFSRPENLLCRGAVADPAGAARRMIERGQRVVIVGAGGHAKVVIELLWAIGGIEVVGLLAERAGQGPFGLPVLGDDGLLPVLRTQGVVAALVALGSNALRDRIGAELHALGFLLPAVIHPSAQLSPSARVSAGAVIMARACVGPLATVGEFSIINTGAIIEHDSAIGRAAHVAPGSVLAGTVSVGERALVGAGSAVRPGVTIGKDSIVGVGSAVVANVPPGAVVGGAPARLLRPVNSS
jgi:UDP-perosamine 4-acetyltransferase